MKAKILNLADFQKTNKLKNVKKSTNYISTNKYKETLKKMTKEDLLAIERLLEN